MSATDESDSAPLLSVVIPVFNEAGTIGQIISAVEAAGIDTQIIAVDDFSTDGTRSQLAQLAEKHPRLLVLHHDANQGKGASLRTGFRAARGRFVVVQDADLEYDPNDFHRLLEPLLAGSADVVYGSRFCGQASKKVPVSLHSLANRFLTRLSNAFTKQKLTDMETCYKMFRREIIQAITIKENRFGFEPEITAKISRASVDGRAVQVCEVPISYRGRTNREGKKIGWKDGVRAIWCIVKYSRR